MRRKSKDKMGIVLLVMIGVLLMAIGFAVKFTIEVGYGSRADMINIVLGIIIWTGLVFTGTGSILLSNLLIRGRR